jgi:hypothetical protein
MAGIEYVKYGPKPDSLRAVIVVGVGDARERHFRNAKKGCSGRG